MGLPVTHIDHCSVIITDVAASRRFYGETLGLCEIPAPRTFDFVALWYDLGGAYLHLLQKPTPDTISPRHFCLHVSDIAAARAQCVSRGLRIDETVKIPGADRFFIHDPDGNRIEILQWGSKYDPERDGRYRV
ncbi:MAG TPA: VOC family protein [Gemmataceae bacterium]|jgi:catechol 2,3-dioxygenase-like lactoylglutathione lyase family enzyme|nr:VOC family protein [Gemmataceae bacterium]